MLIYCKKRKSYKARLNHQKNEKLQKDLLYYYHYIQILMKKNYRDLGDSIGFSNEEITCFVVYLFCKYEFQEFTVSDVKDIDFCIYDERNHWNEKYLRHYVIKKLYSEGYLIKAKKGIRNYYQFRCIDL